MQKKEAKYQTIISAYWKAARRRGVYEVKYCGAKPLRVEQFEAHQLPNLLAVKTGAFHYKIPDAGLGFKPFDGFGFYKDPAFVIPVYTKFFALIDVEVYMQQEKAVSSDTALSIADRVVYL